MGFEDILLPALGVCHGKYGSAPLSGVTDPYSRSLYIGRFLPTNLQLMEERQKHSTFATTHRSPHPSSFQKYSRDKIAGQTVVTRP